MEFLILGPIAVRGASGDVSLGGNKPRAVLAVLLLHPNQPVSAERLALALWGEDAPGGAVKTVQVHVSRLRKALGDPDILTTTPAGYSLRVRAGELDAERFEGLVEDGRQAMADGQAERAAASLREALALWRGPALAELAHEPFAAAEISRLQEQRLAALALRVEADLAAGRHAEVVGELQTLVVDNPLRERLAAQLMLALYRCGRQTEALEAYAAVRRTLVEEMGIEPGPELRERHQAILRQDAALHAQPADVQLPAALDPSNAQPLVGRDEELGWLLARWQVARNGGGGGLVALAGPRGAGKTRLAAELARTAHRPGVTILHASGDGPADSTLVVLRAAREATRPTLLVVDDADRAGTGVLDELARLQPRLADAAVLVVVIAEDDAALAPLQPAGVLAVGPICAEAVREIAARYAPGTATAEVPAEWLLEASAGMPRRVHEAASQWARREAARHVGAVAERAETGRAELRTLEAELAGGVADLQEQRKRFDPGRRDDPPVVCPFKGLATFDAADARYFFGRERLVAEVVARLVGAPLLAIVGPSGSGKSSVMRAGLLPALASGVLPGSETWAQVLIRPGRHPLRELAAALAGINGASRAVLAVDQFEETFTVCDDEAERAEFISELVHAVRDPRRRYVVVIALRADHYGRCAAYPELPALLAESNVLVGSMTRDELRLAVEGPCEQGRLSIEPELVDALVDDVEREPGGLPLLSASLLELWQHRDGRRLRHSAYVRTGGVHGAVARLAEDAFAQLDEAQQAVGRSVLMRLVGMGEDGSVERRRIALEDLEIDRDEDAARVVALLTDRRLLTVGSGSVELAHEALLREWPRLRGWIEEDRDGLRIQRGLSIAAEEWDRVRRDAGALYRGTRLSEAIEWRDAQSRALNELERSFLQAAEAACEHERRTARRRATVLLGSAGTVAVAVVALALVTFYAGRASDVAASRNVAAKAASITAIDPALGLALGREALDRHDTVQAANAVRQATLDQRVIGVVRAHEGKAYVAVPSPDGRRVVSAGADGAVKVWLVDGLRLESSPIKHGDLALGATFDPEGTRVASVALDGQVAVANLDGSARRTLELGADNFAFNVEFSPDGSTLAVGTVTGEVRILPADLGNPGFVLGRHADEGTVYTVSFDRAGRRLVSASADGTARIWDVGGRSLLRELSHAGEVNAATFNPAATQVVSGTDRGVLTVWSAGSGEKLRVLRLDDQPLQSVRFSADGRRLVTSVFNGVTRVLDGRASLVLAELKRHDGVVQYADFARGGDVVVTSGADGTLRTWRSPRDLVARDPGTIPTLSPDGQRVVSGDEDGGVHLWDIKTGRERRLRGFHGFSVTAFAADGIRVLSASHDGPARVYDPRTGDTTDVKTDDSPKYAIVMNRAGRVALAGDTESSDIDVQDVDGGNLVKLRGHRGPVNSLAFSPDGLHLASASDDGTARIWDVATRKARVLPGDSEAVTTVAYSDDGTHVVTGGADGAVRVWAIAGGAPAILIGHEGPLNSAEFSHDANRVVSTGADGTVRVWDVSAGASLTLFVHRGGGTGADLDRAGKRVVSAGPDGMLITPCEVCGELSDVLEVADDRAVRRLSDRDRLRYLGEDE